ncbi:MAG TPA: hypothetical protein VH744_13300, partial [Terriglobales bacterium]
MQYFIAKLLRPAIAAVGMSVALCAIPELALADDREPIAFVGHGAFFDQNGKQIVPTPEFLTSALAWYRTKLLSQLAPEKRSEFEAKERQAAQGLQLEGQSRLVFDARMIDWLLANTDESEDTSGIEGKLNAVKYALEWELPESDDLNVPHYEKRFRLAPQLLERLEIFGSAESGVQLLSATTASGAAYVAECMANDVPIPPPIGQLDPAGLNGWKSQGSLPGTEQFIVGTQAEVMTYQSSAPEGMCIALPRSSAASPSTIILDGVICLGKVSSKVCFWDNQMQQDGFSFPAGTVIPIGSPNLEINPAGQYMAGGAELFQGSGGVCTDCHAGNNPYVIHPGTTLGLPNLAGLPLVGQDFYDPLVHPAWPQNPGPINSPGVCATCHVTGGQGGGFPAISTELGDYCLNVLSNAINRTMPPGAPGSLASDPHPKALLAMCDDPPQSLPQSGQLLSYGDAGTPGNVSAPVVVGFGGWRDFKFLFSGRNVAGENRIYAVDQDGQLLSYGDAGTPGNVSAPVVVG